MWRNTRVLTKEELKKKREHEQKERLINGYQAEEIQKHRKPKFKMKGVNYDK